MNCRGCGSELNLTFLDLGISPIANNLIESEQLNKQNVNFPLHAMTCEKCALVQLSENIPREKLFPPNYTYFSSFSSSWLEHSKIFAQKMTNFLELNENDLVVEIASNDGYLLQYFQHNRIQVLGIEPASGVAKTAILKGIPTLIDYFGVATAERLAKIKKPRLMIGNNVLAHVPDLNDFIRGFSILIQDEGIITFEFPHLLNLIGNNQFDTIYHEHYSYLSITALLPIFTKYNLKIIDIEKIATHGGSLRVFLAKDISNWSVNESVLNIINDESKFDPRDQRIYQSLRREANKIKHDLQTRLLEFKKAGKHISAYGAAAKGVTLLNYCGVSNDLIDYVVDLNPNKQGKFLPGSLIPVVGMEILNTNPPDILLILPWNLSLEIKSQLSTLIESGMHTMRAIPTVEFF
jgi:2-polyprenyl-3-methyl-5-hydroxy-6-metoxy-1,4-benzoquinol methylase